MARHQNHGLRKVCGCARGKWAKCEHPWHFNYKPKGGASYRFSVDTEAGEHIASKTKAEALADSWRAAIRAGTFRRRGEASPVAATPAVMTLRTFSERYAERLGRPLSANDRGCLKRVLAWEDLGARALDAITTDDLEAFFASLRADGLAASSRNKYVQAVSMLFRWATKKGYLPRNPVADAEHLKREKHAQRDRRLDAGEEGRLLGAAGPHLQRIIIAALETGCRRGELLSLTWRDVNLDRREMTIRAERTKTKSGRVIPISARLAGVLEMAKTDPAGEPFGPEAFVFGDVIGRQVGDIKRAWETCVLKAHGQAATWTRTHALSVASRAALSAADLTFHDLRHEAGSRLLEAGWPLHNVAHMLGHANISQTSTYLNATRIGLQDSMRRLDEARGCKLVANDVEADRPPLRNGGEADTAQPLVN
ncbi:MAG TPA: site-specific integrase [Vicinamibacterales bacterium]|nr:site-specific integrase [Vicinamibacterales bacterium]